MSKPRHAADLPPPNASLTLARLLLYRSASKRRRGESEAHETRRFSMSVQQARKFYQQVISNAALQAQVNGLRNLRPTGRVGDRVKPRLFAEVSGRAAGGGFLVPDGRELRLFPPGWEAGRAHPGWSGSVATVARII